MNDDRARSRVVLSGQTRPCAHSVSRVLKKRSIFPFQRGVRGGMRMWRAPGSGGGGGDWGVVGEERGVLLLTPRNGAPPRPAPPPAGRPRVGGAGAGGAGGGDAGV